MVVRAGEIVVPSIVFLHPAGSNESPAWRPRLVFRLAGDAAVMPAPWVTSASLPLLGDGMKSSVGAAGKLSQPVSRIRKPPIPPTPQSLPYPAPRKPGTDVPVNIFP